MLAARLRFLVFFGPLIASTATTLDEEGSRISFSSTINLEGVEFPLLMLGATFMEDLSPRGQSEKIMHDPLPTRGGKSLPLTIEIPKVSRAKSETSSTRVGHCSPEDTVMSIDHEGSSRNRKTSSEGQITMKRMTGTPSSHQTPPIIEGKVASPPSTTKSTARKSRSSPRSRSSRRSNVPRRPFIQPRSYSSFDRNLKRIKDERALALEKVKTKRRNLRTAS